MSIMASSPSVVRVNFSLAFGARRGQKQMGVVQPTLEALSAEVAKKFSKEVKKKEWQLYVGGQALAECEDLAKVLCNDCTVVIADEAPNPAEQVRLSKSQRKAVSDLQWFAFGDGGRLSARGRPSAEQLLALKAAGVSAVVTLLMEDEEGCAKVQMACDRLDLKWCHAPFEGLKDFADSEKSSLAALGPREPRKGRAEIKSSVRVRASLDTTHIVLRWLMAGESVLVHCAAGLHRTGLYLYLLLRLSGRPREVALTAVRAIRTETANEIDRLGLDAKGEELLKELRQHLPDARVVAPALLLASAPMPEPVSAPGLTPESAPALAPAAVTDVDSGAVGEGTS